MEIIVRLHYKFRMWGLCMNKNKKENRPIKIRFIFLISFLIISALSLGITISYFIYNQMNIQSSSEDAEKVRKGQLFLNDNSKEVGDSMHWDKTIEELAKLKSAIVKIETETSQGSGVLIDKSGYLLTNWHVE